MIGSENYKLTEQELEIAVEGRRFSDQVKEIAKASLVDGVSAIDLAKQYNMTRGRIYTIRDKVIAAYLAASTYPSDWKRVSIIASPELIARFLDEAKKEHQAWLASKSGRSEPKAAAPAKASNSIKPKKSIPSTEKKTSAAKRPAKNAK